MRGEALGVRPGGRRAVPEVDRDRQVARAEVAAPGVAAGPAGRAGRVDAARAARQPRVEHDALAGIRPAPDDLVAEHVREGHQRRERVVAGAVQQDLLHVGAAQAREGRLDAHPVRGRKRQLVDVLDADGREAGDEGALVDAPADGRGRLAGQVVPEHERLHVDPPSPGQPNLPRRRPASMTPAARLTVLTVPQAASYVDPAKPGLRRPRMPLKIMPHGRLQEWVAEEKGYFAAAGLEYTFVLSGDYGIHPVRRDDAGEIKARRVRDVRGGPRRRRRELRVPLGHQRRGERAGRPARDHGLLDRAVRDRRSRPSRRSAVPRTWPGRRSASVSTPAVTSPPCRPSRPCFPPMR